MLLRIIQVSSGIFESVIRFVVESVRCLVVLSKMRFHVLHGRSKTGVMLSAADMRRNLCWSSLNTSVAEIKSVTFL